MWFERMPGWGGAVGAVSAVLSAFFLAGLLATAAWPRMHAGPNMLEAGHRLAGATAPLDGTGSFATPAGAYSLRRLKSTYTGPGVRLRRMADSAMLDINFLGFTGFTGAPLDTAAAVAHCTTRCEIEVWYDQSGNGRHASRAGADAADFVADCGNGKPCLRTDASTDIYVSSASVTWAAGRTTFGAVGRRSSGTGACQFVTKSANNIFYTGAANQWLVTDSTTNSFPLAAADNAWHAGVGVIDGASSVGRIDATETAGTNVTGSAAAGPVLAAWGAAATGCDQTEAILWDNYALSQTERAALTANQRAFWGF